MNNKRTYEVFNKFRTKQQAQEVTNNLKKNGIRAYYKFNWIKFAWIVYREAIE